MKIAYRLTEKRREQIVFAILFLYLLFPTLLGLFLAKDLRGWGMHVIYFFAGLGVYVIPLTLLRKRSFLYLSFGLFWARIIDVIHMVMHHATTSILFVYTLTLSEPGEFWELFSSFWFLILIVLAIGGGYLYAVHRYIKNEYICPRRYRRRVMLVFIAFYVVCGIGLAITNSKIVNRWLPINHEDLRTEAFVGVEKANPFNIALTSYHVINLYAGLEQHEKLVKDFSFGMDSTCASAPTDALVVLILGETIRYDHMGIHGYHRPTTPHLDARQGQWVSFDSCYSIANLTTVSVPYMLSPAHPRSGSEIYTDKTFVDAFQEVGYRTAWIADQSFGNTYMLRVANDCDFTHYQPTSKHEVSFMDSCLLKPLEEELNHFGQTHQPTQKQFILLHTLGCHYKYSSRYPAYFAQFLPDLNTESYNLQEYIQSHKPILNLPDTIFSKLKESLINSYDNALLYTDWFINKVITMVEQTHRPAVVVYISDHGENLLDDQRKMMLHGGYRTSRWEYHVPLIVWTSEEYKQRYPDKLSALENNQHKRISTMTLFHSMLNLGGIEHKRIDSTMCIDQQALIHQSVLYGLDGNLKCIELER